jgi:hypothetical protein
VCLHRASSSQLHNSLQRGEVMKCVYREHSAVWGWEWGLGGGQNIGDTVRVVEG